MGYQPPEVNNLNTPTPTGLNDYVWQTQVAVVETVAAFLYSCRWISRSCYLLRLLDQYRKMEKDGKLKNVANEVCSIIKTRKVQSSSLISHIFYEC